MGWLQELLGNRMVSPIPEGEEDPTFFTAEAAQKYHHNKALEKMKDFVSPTPTPRPRMTLTPEDIEAGYEAWGRGNTPPIATMSAALAEFANDPRVPDPRLIPALILKESGGLRDQESARVKNNPGNIMSFDAQGNRSLAQYPNLEVGILGGGPNNQQGMRGTILGGKYDKYLNSGDLGDFFPIYSPAGENADYATQIANTEALMDYFKPGQGKKKKKQKKAPKTELVKKD